MIKQRAIVRVSGKSGYFKEVNVLERRQDGWLRGNESSIPAWYAPHNIIKVLNPGEGFSYNEIKVGDLVRFHDYRQAGVGLVVEIKHHFYGVLFNDRVVDVSSYFIRPEIEWDEVTEPLSRRALCFSRDADPEYYYLISVMPNGWVKVSKNASTANPLTMTPYSFFWFAPKNVILIEDQPRSYDYNRIPAGTRVVVYPHGHESRLKRFIGSVVSRDKSKYLIDAGPTIETAEWMNVRPADEQEMLG